MAVLTIDDAKAYLGISGTAQDGLLSTTIDTAEAVIARRVGPLSPTAAVQRVRGGSAALLVDPPALSLTSITDDAGATVSLAGLYLDTDAGVVTRDDGSGFSARFYTVTYQQGRAADACPADLLEAVRVLVKHLWGPQRGVGARAGVSTSDGASNTIPGAGYLLPFRVQELIAPHMLDGFA